MILKKKYGILVPKGRGEEIIQLLRRLGLLDNGYELIRTEDNLLLPLVRQLSDRELSTISELIGEVRTQFAVFEEVTKKPKTLEETVRGQIPNELIERLPRALDVIGDISVIELPKDLERFSSVIGQGIMKVNQHTRLVLEKMGKIGGQFRTREFEVIAGAGSTETVYREFGCEYHLDVSKVYFNPRLSHERMRVAQQVTAGETVVDMFAGVGPYSVLISKLQPQSTVYSVDVNPVAVKYLMDNAFRNRVADRVIPMFGDAKQLARKELSGLASRIIMNLPSEARNYVPAASQILKPEGGIIHFYAFASREETVETIRNLFHSAVEAQNRKVESFPFSKVIKEVSSNRVQVAIDALVK
jgi:tRNA (guanine37-N1)-methyltransferase